MVIFMPHSMFNDSVYEALAKAKEFNTIDEMKAWLLKRYDFIKSIDEIEIEEDSHDDLRIGCHDKKAVVVNGIGVIGYCATLYDRS